MEDIQRGDSDITLDFFKEILARSDPDVNLDAVQVVEASKRGDNYTSLVYRVTAKGTRKSESWSKSFIYKCIPFSRARREAFKSESLFLNEVAFYTKALPALLKFQSDRGCENFIETPEVFLAKKNVLVLEDLKERNFIMADRRKFLNFEHCQAVVRALAKFHSLSLAMKTLEPETFKSDVVGSISECLFKPDNEEWYHDYYDFASKNAIGFVEDCLKSSENRLKYLEKFKNFLDDTFFQKMVALVQPKEPVSVVCHGDCWSNNILFKYSELGQLSSLCFLDFQLVRYGSPALDLVNFLYICTSRLQRSLHMEHLIVSYCETIKTCLVQLGCPNGPFGDENIIDVIKQEIRHCGKFGLGLAIDMIPITTCDSEQAPDLYVDVSDDNISEEMDNKDKVVWTKNEICKRRMTDLVQELIDKGHL